MINKKDKIKTFTDLEAWKEAHKLVLVVYKIVNKEFPDEEKFGLSSQSKRAVISITSNIAEGFGRRTAKDKRHFYNIAETSLAELQNQFLATRDLEYIKRESFQKFSGQSTSVARLIAGLTRSAADY